MTVTERVLCFYCYWLCWFDIAVGLLVWCLKDRRMNWLTLKVWHLLRGFVFLLLLVLLDWYSGWFVGLIFKRQQNELTYAKSVTVTERVLCFYCYWLVWIDIAVGLMVWCLKDRRMNWLTIKVWQLLRGFVFLLLMVVLGWYSGWFVGLMFKRQQNESTYGESVTVTERFLCFQCYWLCCVDITVGLLVLMFKRPQNELTYGKSVTVTERVLCFYCYCLCWVDIAVGLLVWCLKDNRMNRLTVKVWQLLRGFCVSNVIGCVVLI